jgi:hypothetical protein
VYLVDGSLSWTFVKPTRDWRDRSIFTTTQDSIRSVRFQYGDTTFVLSRADTLWRVDGAPVDQGRVDGFLAALSSFATDDFVDSAITAPGQPAGMVTVDGIQIAFLPHLTPGKYYVRTSLNAQVFEVQDWKAKQVLKRKSDFTGAAA